MDYQEFASKICKNQKIISYRWQNIVTGLGKNLSNIDWGIGQVQSIIGNKVTINFENVGKQVMNIENVKLEKIDYE